MSDQDQDHVHVGGTDDPSKWVVSGPCDFATVVGVTTATVMTFTLRQLLMLNKALATKQWDFGIALEPALGHTIARGVQVVYYGLRPDLGFMGLYEHYAEDPRIAQALEAWAADFVARVGG